MDTTSQKLPDDLASLKAQVKSLDAELFVTLQKNLAINAERGIQDEKLRTSREQEDAALELKRQKEDEEFECTKSYIIHKQIELESRINTLSGAGSASAQLPVERLSNELRQENIKIKMEPGLDSQQPAAPALAFSDLSQKPDSASSISKASIAPTAGAMPTDILTSRILGNQPLPFPAESISTAIPLNEQCENAVHLKTSLVGGEKEVVGPSSLGIDSPNMTTMTTQTLQNEPKFQYKYNE